MRAHEYGGGLLAKRRRSRTIPIGVVYRRWQLRGRADVRLFADALRMPMASATRRPGDTPGQEKRSSRPSASTLRRTVPRFSSPGTTSFDATSRRKPHVLADLATSHSAVVTTEADVHPPDGTIGNALAVGG